MRFSNDRNKDPDVVAFNSIRNALEQSKKTDDNLEIFIDQYVKECIVDSFWFNKLPSLFKNGPYKPNAFKLSRVIAESYIPEGKLN